MEELLFYPENVWKNHEKLNDYIWRMQMRSLQEYLCSMFLQIFSVKNNFFTDFGQKKKKKKNHTKVCGKHVRKKIKL